MSTRQFISEIKQPAVNPGPGGAFCFCFDAASTYAQGVNEGNLTLSLTLIGYAPVGGRVGRQMRGACLNGTYIPSDVAFVINNILNLSVTVFLCKALFQPTLSKTNFLPIYIE